MTVTNRQRLRYLVSDYLTINAGWLIFNVIRYFSLPPGYELRPLEQWLFQDPNIILGQIVYPLMMLGIYAISGFYNHMGVKSRLDEIGNTATVSLIGTLLIFFGTLINDNVPERLHNYELMLILWGLLTVPCLLCRGLINAGRIRARSRGEGLFKALVVGSPAEAEALRKRLSRGRRGSDFDIIGHISPDNSTALEDAIAGLKPQVLLLASSPRSLAADKNLPGMLFSTGLDIYVPLDLYEMMTANPRITSVVSEPLINITASHISPSTANMKRLGDIIVSAVALVFLALPMSVIAVLIKRDSKGPVFYRQERVGYRKKKFDIIKFRTMYTDAEAGGPALATTDDPRITPLGRVLRKYRIDELPQFWNVLRGDMSLVGPRPEREFFVRKILEKAPHYTLVHQVRPGITSWGMVKFGYAGSVDEMLERLRFDMLYLENVSLAVDLKILFYTVHTVLTGKGV